MSKVAAEPTGEQVVAAARTWLGTPWHHAACCKRVGVDCALLMVGIAREMGWDLSVDANYTQGYELPRMLSGLGRHCTDVTGAPVQAGDVLVFSGRMMPNHCGLATGEGTFIHAYQSVNAVVESALDENWRGRIVAQFRWRALMLPNDAKEE